MQRKCDLDALALFAGRPSYDASVEGYLKLRVDRADHPIQPSASTQQVLWHNTELLMALEPLATKGNVLHLYDFRVKEGKANEFMKLFEEFDYSPENPMHKSAAQLKDGVLCRHREDPNRFYLIGEWKSVEEHRKILKVVAEMRPKFIGLVEGGPAGFVPTYIDVVLSTPPEYLQPQG
jgi:quinol monooxygenase YgiN